VREEGGGGIKKQSCHQAARSRWEQVSVPRKKRPPWAFDLEDVESSKKKRTNKNIEGKEIKRYRNR